MEHLKRKGKRLECNRVKVRVTKNGQFSATIPRRLANSEKMQKGTILFFEKLPEGGLKLTCYDYPNEIEEIDKEKYYEAKKRWEQI